MNWEEFHVVIRHLTQNEQAIIQRAFEMGSKAHEGQTRKSGEPYFTHPIAVATILVNLDGDCDTIVAGLLHDAVEDTMLTLTDVEHAFGANVATLIDGVTKLESKDIEDLPHLDRQIETLRKMFTLMQQDVRIMVIKLADRLHNMQTIRFRSLKNQMRIAHETMDVYVKIADRLCMRDLQNSLESLCLGVLEPELFDHLQSIRAERETQGQRIAKMMETRLAQEYAAVSAHTAVHLEQKSWYRLREQLKSQNQHVTGMATVAVAIVCTDIDHCYRMLGALHQEWQREILSFQDFINSPMINGYQGLHTTIIMHDGTRVRCKIRTATMHDYAHRGIAVYCFDSKAKGALEYLPWTKRIADISIDTRDRSAEFWEGLQSDILGSTTVIHGPDDNTIMLPVGATALDAAFYLFGDLALRVTELFVNGQPAAFDHILENAATISATFAKMPVATLRWLHSVNTAVSLAIIRKQLSAAPSVEKITVGHELFNTALRRFTHIDLDEIEPSLFVTRLQHAGIISQDRLFEEIAEGKIDATETVSMLFSDFRQNDTGTVTWVLRATVPTSEEERIIRSARVYPAIKISTRTIRDHSRIVIRLTMNQLEADALDTTLHAFLPPDSWSLQRATSTQFFVISVTILLVLWGLDPVVARSLLTHGLTPYDLTFIRAATFFCASSTLYAAQLLFYGKRHKWLSPMNPTLMLSGAAMFTTALLSYLALSMITATAYIFCIIGGLLVVSLLKEVLQPRRWYHTAGALLILGGGVAIGAYVLGYTEYVLLAGIGSGLSFALYSELSKRYQRDGESIRARYPAFLFWMSCIGLALSGTILPLTTFDAVDPLQVATSILFALTFSVLPYSLYFEITRRIDSPLLDRSLPLVTIITITGELLLNNFTTSLLALPMVLLFLAYYYGMYGRKNETRRTT